jgi:hypothetical protein
MAYVTAVAPIGGNGMKSYLMIMSCVQLACFLALSLRPLTWQNNTDQSYWGLVWCFFVGFFSMVWIDTIV